MVWLEIDTGSDSALIINEALATRVGLASAVTASDARIDIRLDAGAPVRTPVEKSRLIFDGNLGLGTMRSWVLTFDLGNERVWIRTPQAATHDDCAGVSAPRLRTAQTTSSIRCWSNQE